MNNKNLYRSGCPLASALDVVGDKWSLIIIRDLFLERTTFKEFLSGPEKIASNILSQRLKWLNENAIIDFTHKKNNRKEKHYFLSEKGIELFPAMFQMMEWSKKHLDKELDPLTLEWDEKNKHKSDFQKVNEMIFNYKTHKENLLLSA